MFCISACSGVIDIIFVLDSSGSEQSQRFQIIQQVVVDVIQQLEISFDRTRVGLVYFSDLAILDFNLLAFPVKQDLIEAIKRVPYIGGKTNTADAISLLYTNAFTQANGDRQEAPNIAIIFTDGGSNINRNETIYEGVQAKIRGTRLMVAGIGDYVNLQEVTQIGSDPVNRNVFTTPWNYNKTIIDQLVNGTCNGRWN